VITITVAPYQSEKLPWISFLNLLLLYLLLCARYLPSISFVSKVKKVDKVNWPDAYKTEFIMLEFFRDPYSPASGSNYCWNFTIFKDGWIHRELDQVVDVLLWDWKPDALEETC
jgi:hypothetical protein